MVVASNVRKASGADNALAAEEGPAPGQEDQVSSFDTTDIKLPSPATASANA
ncbi:MAG: hypothetical protein AAF543_07580 [Pseudomonadota bacterium]